MTDYEAEVKKVYPMAKLEFYISDITNDIVYFVGASPVTLSDDFTTPEYAWRSAYETLKEKQLINP